MHTSMSLLHDIVQQLYPDMCQGEESGADGGASSCADNSGLVREVALDRIDHDDPDEAEGDSEAAAVFMSGQP